jgi:hypothetical protein
MTAKELMDVSTKLLIDMKVWVTEAGKDGGISPADLAVLNAASQVVERVTMREFETSPENFADQEREGHD